MSFLSSRPRLQREAGETSVDRSYQFLEDALLLSHFANGGSSTVVPPPHALHAAHAQEQTGEKIEVLI